MRAVLKAVLSLLFVGSTCSEMVRSQTIEKDGQYPVRPVRIILGYAAGGTVDLVARGIAEELAQGMKQHVLVENRPGAGGSIASEYAAKATPDGHTLYLGGLDSIVYSFRAAGRKPLDPVKDFLPIAEVARNEFLMVVNNGLPASSVSDLIRIAKARPQSILFASNGSGSTLHVLAERFAVAAGIDIVHVPYKQGLVADLLAGRVHLVFAPAPSIRDHIAAGKLKVLATLAPQRSTHAPDRPTLVEAGFPGFWHIGLLHLYAPAATPRSVVLRLNREMREALQAPRFQNRLVGLGDVPGTPMSTHEAIAVLRERRTWMDKSFEIAMSAKASLGMK